MKNSLMIPLVFFLNLVIWVCSISFFSVLGTWQYLDALAGGNIKLFLVVCGYKALYFFPLGVMLGLLFVFFFLMRHRSAIFLSIPLVIILSAGSVLFALPATYRLMERIEAGFPDALGMQDSESSKMYETRFIRKGSDPESPFWIDLSIADDRQRSVLVAHTGSSGDVLSFYPEATYDRKSRSLKSGAETVMSPSGGSDPLFSGSMALPRYIFPFISDTAFLLESFRAAWRSGFMKYVWLAGSFFLAVSVLWVFCYSTGWRMLNVVLAFSAMRLFFFLWKPVLDGIVRDFVADFLPAFVSPDLLTAPLYIVFSILVLLIATGVFIKRKLKRSALGGSYE